MQRKCTHCGLPTSVHFAFCVESGIRFAKMPDAALRPGAIQSDPRELRWINPVASGLMKPERRGK